MIRSRPKQVPILEAIVILISILILGDLYLGFKINLVKNGLSISPVAAITFIIAAASKILFDYSFSNPKLLLQARILALCTIAIGIISFIALVFGLIPKGNLADSATEDVMASVKDMPLITAFSFILIGSALYRMTFNNAEKIFFPHIISLIILLIALLSVITYFFHENTNSQISFYKPMKIVGAMCFTLLAFSILLVNSRKGFIGDLTSQYQGGRIARVLIPIAIIVPATQGFYQIRSENGGWYTDPFDVALLTLGRIIILVLFIWRVAVIINRSNKALLAEIEVRKKNEERMRYKKAVLEAQNEAIPDAVLVVDTEGKMLSYNHHFGTLWGLPQNILDERDDTAALKFAITRVADPEGFIDRVNYVYQHPEKAAHDEVLFKDGRIIERYGNVVIGDNGEKYGWAWYFRDITFKKNYENKITDFNKELETKVKERTEELNKSEKRFRSLIENAHDIISLSDENGNRFYVSPAIERITGYSMEETINQSVFNIVHPDDKAHTKKLRDEFMSEPGVLKPISFRFIHKNGHIVWIEGTIVNLLYDENVKAVVGNFHDVSERKISEEKIRLTNERFEMVSRATNDSVWDWNLETDEIYWNDAIKTMFDHCAGDIATGSSWKVHIHPQDFNRVTKKLVYHIKNRIQNWQDEYRFLCSDDTYKFVFNRGFILFNNDGKPYRIIGAMQDVTEINKLQQSLNNERIKNQRDLINATIEGQEKERAEIGRELHDNINQLLTASKLYLNVGETQPAMKDEMIKRSAEHISKCMEEIRKLSSALVPPSIGINSFADIIQDLIEPVKLATAIKIDYEITGVNRNILTTGQQLNVYRIVQEHLNNIIKHAMANHVFISVKFLNDQVTINIKDDGQGFDLTARRKGIGFKNIQSRAELLNGRMNIISMPGEGCLLEVNFPVNQPDALTV